LNSYAKHFTFSSYLSISLFLSNFPSLPLTLSPVSFLFFNSLIFFFHNFLSKLPFIVSKFSSYNHFPISFLSLLISLNQSLVLWHLFNKIIMLYETLLRWMIRRTQEYENKVRYTIYARERNSDMLDIRVLWIFTSIVFVGGMRICSPMPYSRFINEKNIIAASFLYVSKNADVGNESSRNKGAARCREEQEQKKDTAYRETRALTVTSAW